MELHSREFTFGTNEPPRTCRSECGQIIPCVEDQGTRAFVSGPLDSQLFPRTITGALESLRRRVGIFDEETGNLGHPLFATRAVEARAAGGEALRPYGRAIVENCLLTIMTLDRS
jgi:hypothetical protein